MAVATENTNVLKARPGVTLGTDSQPRRAARHAAEAPADSIFLKKYQRTGFRPGQDLPGMSFPPPPEGASPF